MNKIFTSEQIFIATFIGSPIAAIFMIYNNHKILNKEYLLKHFILLLIALLISSMIVFYLVFDSNKNLNDINEVSLFQFSLVLMVLFLPAYLSAKYSYENYMTKQEILNSDHYVKKSYWKVFIITVASFCVYSIVNNLIWVLLDGANLSNINLEE